MNDWSVFQIVFSVLLGAALASFFNVVAHRSVKGQPWWGRQRSACEACGKELTAAELVPLLSWLIQKGRCRGCGARISTRYLAVEVIGASASGLMAWRWGISWAYALSMGGVFGLLLNALTDYETGDVFDVFALAMGIPAILIRLIGGRDAVIDGLLGAAAGWGVFALIILASRGGMGWGDATCMGGLGAIFGWKLTLLAFYIGILCGGAGIAWLMLRGKVKWGRGDSIPLVPYLAVGGLLTFLWGPQILWAVGLRFNYFIEAGWPW